MPDEPKPKLDNFIAKVVGDPAKPQETLLLRGFLGASSEPNSTRIYADPTLEDYVDVGTSDIVHSEPIPKDQSPLGGSYIWIKKDAEVLHGKAGTERTKAKFLEGPIAAAAVGGTAVAAGPVAALPPTINVFACQPSLVVQFCQSRLPAQCPPSHPPVFCPPSPLHHCPPSPPPLLCPQTPLCPSGLLGCPPITINQQQCVASGGGFGCPVDTPQTPQTPQLGQQAAFAAAAVPQAGVAPTPPIPPTNLALAQCVTVPCPSLNDIVHCPTAQCTVACPSVHGYHCPTINAYQCPSVAGYQCPSVAGYQCPSVAGYQCPTVNSYHCPSVAGYHCPTPACPTAGCTEIGLHCNPTPIPVHCPTPNQMCPPPTGFQCPSVVEICATSSEIFCVAASPNCPPAGPGTPVIGQQQFAAAAAPQAAQRAIQVQPSLLVQCQPTVTCPTIYGPHCYTLFPQCPPRSSHYIACPTVICQVATYQCPPQQTVACTPGGFGGFNPGF